MQTFKNTFLQNTSRNCTWMFKVLLYFISKNKKTSRTFFGSFSVFYTKIEEYFLTLAWKFIKKSISIFQNFSKQLFLQIHLPGQLTLFFIKLPVSSTLIHFNPMFPYLFPLMFSGGTLSGGIKCDPWPEMGQQHKIWSL